jgi:hypothetical protein
MFTSPFTKSIAGTAVAAGTLGLAALIAAGTANAGTATDQQFLKGLQQHGISVENPQAAIKVGHRVCTALGEGTTPRDISAQLVNSNDGMDPQTSLFFIVDSVQSYCPQYMHRSGDGEVVISAAS